jgi:hypothetical protein
MLFQAPKERAFDVEMAAADRPQLPVVWRGWLGKGGREGIAR